MRLTFAASLLAALPVSAKAQTTTSETIGGSLLTQGLESSYAVNGTQPAAASNCPFIANTSGPASACLNFESAAATDYGYYFGFRAGSGGGAGVEVDTLAAPAASNSYTGSWTLNPLITFFPGATSGTATTVLLSNRNVGSTAEYDGIVVQGSGSAGNAAAVDISGVGTIWNQGILIANGVSNDGVLDTSNAWIGIDLQTSHTGGVVADAGTTFSNAFISAPSDPASGSNTEFGWAPENGSTTAAGWEFGPAGTYGAYCGLCVGSASAEWGSYSEADFTPGGGMKISGALSYGASGTGHSHTVHTTLIGGGSGAFVLSPDGGVTGTLDTETAEIGLMMSSNGVQAIPASTTTKTVSAIVACSGGVSAPTVIKLEGIYGGATPAVLSQTATRLIGNSTSPTVTFTTDSVGTIIPMVSASVWTICSASVRAVIN